MTYNGLLDFSPILPYKWHRFIHIISAIIFLGNVIIGPFWTAMAIQSKNKEYLKFSFRLLLLTDAIITLPAMTLIVINGLFMASNYGDFTSQPQWLIHSIYSLFALWILTLPIIFIQNKMKQHIDEETTNTKAFRKLTNWWVITGGISFIPLGLLVFWMVMKSF